jgi:predicted nucleic acid-binding protein
MPRYLLDTNVLLRLVKRDDPQHKVLRIAIEALITENHDLCYTPQNIVEFWNVFTRPRERNGYGLTIAEADYAVTLIELQFTLLPDTDRIHMEWRRLVLAHSVSGAKVHDARLVAAMKVHSLTHLLTFNTSDFDRYSDITPVHPQDVVKQSRK